MVIAHFQSGLGLERRRSRVSKKGAEDCALRKIRETVYAC
jgi:hypothetical protein